MAAALERAQAEALEAHRTQLEGRAQASAAARRQKQRDLKVRALMPWLAGHAGADLAVRSSTTAQSVRVHSINGYVPLLTDHHLM